MTEIPVSSPLPLNLAEAHVHTIDTSEGDPAPFTRLLSGDEQERAARFKVEPARGEFILTRGSLRILAGRYLNAKPETLAFVYGPRGKPALAAPHEWLAFSVSHTRGRSAVAFARNSPIGVDIEQIRPVAEWEAIAQREFTPWEYAEIQAAEPAARPLLFLQCWARKEAYIKVLGGGVAIPLDGFYVGTAVARVGSYAVQNLPLQAPYIGAIAVPSRGTQVLHFGPFRASELMPAHSGNSY